MLPGTTSILVTSFLGYGELLLLAISTTVVVAQSPGQPAAEEFFKSTANGHVYERYSRAVVGGPTTVPFLTAKSAAEGFTHPDCPNVEGHLVTVENAAESAGVANLCDALDDNCWIGVIREGGFFGSDFGWVTGEDFTYTNWDPATNEPNTGNLYAYYHHYQGAWRSQPHGVELQNFVVEYDCPLPPDLNWDVSFVDATTATFDDTGATDPEVVLTYAASAPDGDDKYYEQKVLLKDCETYAPTNGAVAAAILRIPDSDYIPDSDIIPPGDPDYNGGGSGELTTRVHIDTSTIEGSAFWTRMTATRGKIEFCVEMELHNEQDLSMAVEYTVVTLDVDTTTGFQVTGVNYTNELQTSHEEDVRVDYPITTYFCDDSDTEVTPAPTLFPGDVLQVCVKTDSADATVTDVRSVSFVNTAPEPDLSLEVIDSDGVETNGQTLKSCDAATGVCNIKTVTFSSLYQLDTDNDGVLEDVSGGAGMEGIAVLNFGPPSTRRLGGKPRERRLATITGFDVDLAGNLQQLPASGDDGASSSMNGATVRGSIGAGIGVAALVGVALLVRNGQKTQVPRAAAATEPAEPESGMD